jgi:N-acetylglucosamine transport system permease protein
MNTNHRKAGTGLRKGVKGLSLVPSYLTLALWFLFTVVLVGWIVSASLSTTPEIFSGKLLNSGLHFENYERALFKNDVGLYLLNSVLYTLSSCALVLLIGIPAAYALSRFVFRFNKVIQYLFVAGLGIPTVMIVMPLYAITVRSGLLNSRLVLIFLYTAISVPFTVYFLIAFFKNIPTSIEEAAAIDGCSNDQTLWRIMLPMAAPGVLTVTIFNFITTWNEYFISLTFINKSALRQAGVGLYAMVQSMIYTGDWSGLFASVMLIFLPTFFLYLFLSKYIIGGVTAGSVKG